MYDILLGNPIFAKSAGEVAAERANQSIYDQLDPQMQETSDSPLGGFIAGARSSSVFGAGIYRGTQKVFNFLSPEGSQDPLNLTQSVDTYNPISDPMSYNSMIGNNPETITAELNKVPFEDWGYLLASPTHGEFQQRLQYVKMALPENLAQMENVTAGKLYGTATDLSAMMAIGAAAEPLALMGLGARAELAGQTAYEAFGATRMTTLAEAATNAANTVSRANLGMRYMALGMAEQSVYEFAKSGIDPNHHPETKDVLESIAVSGMIAGGVGGVLFGKTILRANIQEAAKDLRRSGVTTYPGGFVAPTMDEFAFKSNALVDAMHLHGTVPVNPKVFSHTIDALWQTFLNKGHLAPGQPKSLLFQVLQEIKDRGGNVDQTVIAEVVDSLRSLVKSPPTRLTAAGRASLDTNARRMALAEIINSRVPTPGAINIPERLIRQLSTRSSAAATAAAEAAAKSAKPGDALFRDVSKVTWQKIWGISSLLNQAALAMESKNGAARFLASIAFNAKRVLDTPQATTIFESGMQVVHATLSTFTIGFRNSYTRFAIESKLGPLTRDMNLVDVFKTSFGAENRALRAEYNSRVIAQLRGGQFNDASDVVNEFAKGVRTLFNKMHERANSVGLEGFTNSAVNNYFPRMWQFDKIRRLASTEAGKKDLIAVIEKALDQGGRKVVINGIEETYVLDPHEAAIAFAERLIDIAKGTENASVLAHDQQLFDALSKLDGPLKVATASRTPFGRSRVLLDETASVATTIDHLNHGKRVMSIADLTHDDLPMIFKRYTTSLMGAINERRFINAWNEEVKARGVLGVMKTLPSGKKVRQPVPEAKTIDEVFATAKEIGGEIEPRQEAALRELVAVMRLEPLHSGTSTLPDKTRAVLMSYGYLTKGGQFGLAALGEIGRLQGTLGARQMWTQMPILSEMLSNWKNLDRPAKNFASLMDSWFSPSTDRLRREFVHVVTPTDQYAGGLQRGMNSASNLLSDVSLLAPITSWTQQLTAATSMQHLWEVSNGISKRLDKATVSALGLKMDEYESIIKYVGANAKMKDGFFGKRVVGMADIDAKEMDLVRNFVDRMVRSRIQDMPTRGDFHKSMFGFWGSLVTQFRSFNIKGIDNFLIQNSTRVANGGGARVASEIGTTLFFAGLIQYGRSYADWASFKAAGDEAKAQSLEAKLTIPGALRGAATGPSEFFLAAIGTDAAWTLAVDPDPIFAPYRYSGQGLLGMPVVDTVQRAGGIARDIYGATVARKLNLGVQRDITQGTAHSFRLLTPAQTMPGISQFYNFLEQQVTETYNLQRTQPRDR